MKNKDPIHPYPNIHSVYRLLGNELKFISRYANWVKEIGSNLIHIFLGLVIFGIIVFGYQQIYPYSYPGLLNKIVLAAFTLGLLGGSLVVPYRNLGNVIIPKLRRFYSNIKNIKPISKRKKSKLTYKVGGSKKLRIFLNICFVSIISAFLICLRGIVWIFLKLAEWINSKIYRVDKKDLPKYAISYIFQILFVLYLVYLIMLNFWGLTEELNYYFLVIVILFGAISIFYSPTNEKDIAED